MATQEQREAVAARLRKAEAMGRMAAQDQREAVAARLREAEAILAGLLGGESEIDGFSLGGPRGNVSACVSQAAKLLAEAREGAEA